MKLPRRLLFAFLKMQDIYLGQLACHAMQLRGFSRQPVHPKHLFDERKNEVLDTLLRPGISFLDIGSGVGTECILAAERGAQIACGIEINEDSLKTARQRAAQQSKNVFFIFSNLESGRLPFRDNSFDVINFTNVLEHIENRNEILEEIARVKKPEGLMVLAVPNAQTTWKRWLSTVDLDPRDDADHKIEYTKESLHQELALADLKILSDMRPVIPSIPWNGLIAMSAFLSPKLYQTLQKRKKAFVKHKPKEATGWIMTVQ